MYKITFNTEGLKVIIKEVIPKVEFVLNTYALDLRSNMSVHSPRGLGALRRSYKIINARIEGDSIIVEVVSELPYARRQDASGDDGEAMHHVPRAVLGQQSFADSNYRQGEGLTRSGNKSNRRLSQNPRAVYQRGLYHSKRKGRSVVYEVPISELAREDSGEKDLIKKVEKAFLEVIRAE